MHKYPDLHVVGTYSPPFGLEKEENEIDEVIRRVKEAEPHILIIVLGCSVAGDISSS